MQSHHNNALPENTELTPEQVYLSAIGMFDAAGYTCELVVTGRGKPVEYARVFSKGDYRHILYYPGYDNLSPTSKEMTQLKINNSANDAIRYHYQLPLSKLQMFQKHNVVIDSKTKGHFIYVYSHQRRFYSVDTMNNGRLNRLPYDNFGIDQLQPELARTQQWLRISSKVMNNSESGHCLLQILQKQITDESAATNRLDIGDFSKQFREQHSEWYNRGKQMTELRHESAGYREAVHDRPVAPLPMRKFSYTPSQVLKAIGKGLLIGLVLAGIITLCFYTFGGAAVIITAGAFVGGACGVVGTGSTLFGIAMLAGFVAAITAIYSVIRDYQFTKKMYQARMPAPEHDRVQPNALTGSVLQTLGVTKETLNHMNTADLPPPPPYTSDMVPPVTDAAAGNEIRSAIRPE